MAKHLWVVELWALLGTACSSEGGTQPVPSCMATSGQVSLGVAAYAIVNPTPTPPWLPVPGHAGCVVFPANPVGSTIQYLAVPQSASPIPDDSQAFKLGGNPLAAPFLSPALAAPPAPAPAPRAAQLFDARLRATERELGRHVPVAPRAPHGVVPALAPVDSGSVRTFKVCNTTDCDPRNPSTLSSVTGTALKVGAHIAIFVDNAAPSGGLTQSDLDNLRTVFDTRLYETDTAAFGRESDIDGNGMVIVLMTNLVNQLATAAACNTTGFIAGYFFGADLITTPPFATGNNGEIFYSIVPDPTGTLSCAHPVTEVTQLVPVTFAHEFQHMINFNQHFLKRGAFPEDLWLNEGLSHYAEQHAGRTFLPDTATFCHYVLGDMFDAGEYFAAPQQYALVDTSGIGTLANRGSAWLFVQFLVDQFAADASVASQNAVTRALEATELRGAANVAAATGTDFARVVARWGLANYVSDLPGFAAPPELQYVTWRFRSAFPAIRNACGSAKIPSVFPLDTATHGFAGSTLAASGMLHAGSGSYYLLQQPGGTQQFTLLFTDNAGAALRPTLVPRLNVIRLQ